MYRYNLRVPALLSVKEDVTSIILGYFFERVQLGETQIKVRKNSKNARLVHLQSNFPASEMIRQLMCLNAVRAFTSTHKTKAAEAQINVYSVIIGDKRLVTLLGQIHDFDHKAFITGKGLKYELYTTKDPSQILGLLKIHGVVTEFHPIMVKATSA